MEWMYDDAMHLKENGRLKGCLCLLLCLIDGLAAKESPREDNNKRRYCEYLKARLQEIGIDPGCRIEELDKVIHLSEIIYKYFRCNLVHEADSREEPSYEVQLEWQNSGRSAFATSNILLDRSNDQNNQVVVRANWLIEVLSQIVRTAIHG
jgi:hypothetical protein